MTHGAAGIGAGGAVELAVEEAAPGLPASGDKLAVQADATSHPLPFTPAGHLDL